MTPVRFPLWSLQKRMRFQVMSDLHLEVGQQYEDFDIVPCAPRIILAGDIGRLIDYEVFHGFLHSLCQKFEEVYLVLGNHEFFGASLQEGLRLAYKLEQEPNMKDKLIIMNRKRVDLGDVVLLGCTLHSHIPHEAEEIVQSKINDFRRIVNWTISNHNMEHTADVKWLAENITSIRQAEADLKRKIVVISHHAPLTKGTSKSSDEGNPWSSAFATDLIGRKEMPCFDDVQWWIYGHTHFSTEFVRGQVKLLSNQRGYVLSNKDDDKPNGRKSWPKLPNFLVNNRQLQGRFDSKKVILV